MIGLRIGPQIGARLGPSIGTASAGTGAAFIASVQAAASDPGDIVITASTPPETIEDDTLLLFVAADDVALDASLAILPDGWSVAAVLSTGGRILNVLRRTATSSEPAQHEIELPFVADIIVAGVLLVYRGLDTGEALVGSAIADVSASTNFPCPSQTLIAGSELYLGIVFTVDVDITPPVGTTERIDASQDTLNATGSSLEVFEFFKGSPGATGAKTATTADPRSGFAASILLSVQ